MRAVRYDGQHVLLDPRAPSPEPRPGEAIVRPLRVALGPIDRLVCQGGTGFRGVIGREMVGVVERVEGQSGHELIGARVVCDPVDAPLDSDLARRGVSWHAPDRRELGVCGRDGCLAEQVCVPLISLRKVPDSIDNDHAVLCVTLSEALRLAGLVAVETKPYVTVVGDDAVALLCAQVLFARNAAVRVLGQAPERYTRCEKWGIKHRHVSDAGRLADQDVVLVVDPTDDALRVAAGLVRPGGRVVIGGGVTGATGVQPDDSPSLPVDAIIQREARVIGARGGKVIEALGALANSAVPLDLVSLITRRTKFDDAIGAIRASDAIDQIKVVIDL